MKALWFDFVAAETGSLEISRDPSCWQLPYDLDAEFEMVFNVPHKAFDVGILN